MCLQDSPKNLLITVSWSQGQPRKEMQADSGGSKRRGMKGPTHTGIMSHDWEVGGARKRVSKEQCEWEKRKEWWSEGAWCAILKYNWPMCDVLGKKHCWISTAHRPQAWSVWRPCSINSWLRTYRYSLTASGGSQTIPVGDLDLSDFELDLWNLPYLECTSHHPNATLLQCFSVFVLMVWQRWQCDFFSLALCVELGYVLERNAEVPTWVGRNGAGKRCWDGGGSRWRSDSNSDSGVSDYIWYMWEQTTIYVLHYNYSTWSVQHSPLPSSQCEALRHLMAL